MGKAQYWLMKSEPDVFSIRDLERKGSECWDGVRNYQARNFMRDMRKGDLVLFYHSNATPPGVAGLAQVCRESYPDHTQFDAKSKYYDAKSKEEDPRWTMVDVQFVEAFAEFISLEELKDDPKLKEMRVTPKGSRLSVQPVDKRHFVHVLKRATAKTIV